MQKALNQDGKTSLVRRISKEGRKILDKNNTFYLNNRYSG